MIRQLLFLPYHCHRNYFSDGFLYYTQTDFMPFTDSQKRPKFIWYSCIQFTAQYIFNCFYEIFITH